MGLAVDRLGGSVRQQSVLGRGLEGKVEQTGEDVDRDGLLVVGDRQPALGDMEYASSGAPVITRVVQYSIGHSVARDKVGTEIVAVDG